MTYGIIISAIEAVKPLCPKCVPLDNGFMLYGEYDKLCNALTEADYLRDCLGISCLVMVKK